MNWNNKMKNTIILLILLVGSLKGFSRDIPDTTVPFSSIPIYLSSNHDSDRIIGLVSLGNGLWANKTFWAIDLKKDRLKIGDTATMLSALWTAINNKQNIGGVNLSDSTNVFVTPTQLIGFNYINQTGLTSTLTSYALKNNTLLTGLAKLNADTVATLRDARTIAANPSTQYNLNNIKMFGAMYSGSQTFTLPFTPKIVYWAQVWNKTQAMFIPYDNFSLSGSNVTFSLPLNSSDSVVVQYDIGSAAGTIDSTVAIGLHSEAYYNTKYAKTITLTTTGTSGASTWDPASGALNIPQYAGGGGGGTITQQNDNTTGSTFTISNVASGDIWFTKNPASAVDSYTLTMPATLQDNQRVIISFGGTMTSGTVATSLTIVANTGETLLQSTVPRSAVVGDCVVYLYKASNGTLQKIN